MVMKCNYNFQTDILIRVLECWYKSSNAPSLRTPVVDAKNGGGGLRETGQPGFI